MGAHVSEFDCLNLRKFLATLVLVLLLRVFFMSPGKECFAFCEVLQSHSTTLCHGYVSLDCNYPEHAMPSYSRFTARNDLWIRISCLVETAARPVFVHVPSFNACLCQNSSPVHSRDPHTATLARIVTHRLHLRGWGVGGRVVGNHVPLTRAVVSSDSAFSIADSIHQLSTRIS